jgi:hypothetical protein
VAQEISSGIHCLSSFGRWLITPPLLSAFAACPVLVHWEFGGVFSFLPCPLSPGQVQHSTPTLLSVLDYSLLFMFCSYVGSSVLNAALCLWRSALGSTTSAVLGGGLSPSSCSQPLVPNPCLFTESSVLSLAPCPTPFSREVSRLSPSPHYWC